jgi:hypothetical protein
MRFFCPRSITRRSLVWLLGLALLLPVAQLTATWHGFSHIAAASSAPDDERQAAHATHCDLCLTAAAVAAGALPGTGSVAIFAPVQLEAPQFAFSGIRAALTAPAYRSRAPPLASI